MINNTSKVERLDYISNSYSLFQ